MSAWGGVVRRALSLGGGMLIVGCVYHTPAPPGLVSDPGLLAERDSVLVYARSLRYDSTTHGVSDRQMLTTYDSATGYRVGPVATIYPEAGANHNTYADLAGRGRIVGRIETDSAYPKLGLRRGVNYIWVDSLRLSGDTGLGRAVVIPDDPSLPAVVLPMFYLTDHHGTEGPAAARWLFRPKDEAGWYKCTKTGCCAVGVSSSAGLDLTTGLYSP